MPTSASLRMATTNGSNMALMTGVFFLVGSLQPSRGGAIVVHNITMTDLQNRVSDDPFVSKNVVSAQILEITPAKADERLQFMIE